MHGVKKFTFSLTSGMLLATVFHSGLVVAEPPKPVSIPGPSSTKAVVEAGAQHIPAKLPSAVTDAPVNPVKLPAASDEFVPTEYLDLGFARYVDLGQVGPALNSRNSELLADIALQLAEGERVLLRGHKSGLTSRGLLKRAAIAASEQGDEATLKRLNQAASDSNDQALIAELSSLKKVGGASRASHAGLAVSLENAPLDTIVEIKECLNLLKEAALIGDPALLDAVDAKIAKIPGASDTQKAALKEQVQKSRSEIPAAESAESRAIVKLAGSSRGGLIGLYVYPSQRGALISSFIPGTDAARLNWQGELMTGDVIVAYDGNRVWSAQDIIAISNQYPDGTTLRMDLETSFGAPFWLNVTPGGGQVAAASCAPGAYCPRSHGMRVGSHRPRSGSSAGPGRPDGVPGGVSPDHPGVFPGRPRGVPGPSGPGRPRS